MANALTLQNATIVGSPRTVRPGLASWGVSILALSVVAGGVIVGPQMLAQSAPAAAAPPPPSVAVSAPLQRDVDGRLEFLGQFSAVENVELRPQVGGTLTKIGFKDGDIVHEGDVLFEIDPTPYAIRLSQANAQLASARAKLDLAERQAFRADSLRQTGYGSIETADQRASDKRAAQAAVEAAEAAIRDAQFDLDHTKITAPFTGRIGTHLVSIGNLISGSRAGTSPTTMLGTLVSTGPIYVNFDMSESDYMTFQRERGKEGGALAEKVRVSLSDESSFGRDGTLNFVDNVLNRASGTIHARATIPNDDLLLTPGGFARVRVSVAKATPALLVPDASVLPDQSDHIVLTVGTDNKVTPKQVKLGDLRDGLRIIRSGLAPTDRVIIDGIPTARPGATVSPHVQAMKAAENSDEG